MEEQAEVQQQQEEKEQERQQEGEQSTYSLHSAGKGTTTTKRSLLQDLAIQSNTPWGMVDGYVKTFYELHQEGVLDRQLVIKSLYVWEAEGGRE